MSDAVQPVVFLLHCHDDATAGRTAADQTPLAAASTTELLSCQNVQKTPQTVDEQTHTKSQSQQQQQAAASAPDAKLSSLLTSVSSSAPSMHICQCMCPQVLSTVVDCLVMSPFCPVPDTVTIFLLLALWWPLLIIFQFSIICTVPQVRV